MQFHNTPRAGVHALPTPRAAVLNDYRKTILVHVQRTKGADINTVSQTNTTIGALLFATSHEIGRQTGLNADIRGFFRGLGVAALAHDPDDFRLTHRCFDSQDLRYFLNCVR